VVLCLVRDTLGAPVPIEVLRQLRQETSLLPLEERLVKHIGLNAACIVDVEESPLYEWMLLDLLTNLLSCRTRREACYDVMNKIAQRARTGLANKWGHRVKWPASRF
jgi:hypothetical protein